jgi:hypothetical protein
MIVTGPENISVLIKGPFKTGFNAIFSSLLSVSWFSFSYPFFIFISILISVFSLPSQPHFSSCSFPFVFYFLPAFLLVLLFSFNLLLFSSPLPFAVLPLVLRLVQCSHHSVCEFGDSEEPCSPLSVTASAKPDMLILVYADMAAFSRLRVHRHNDSMVFTCYNRAIFIPTMQLQPLPCYFQHRTQMSDVITVCIPVGW